jgi:hypothetical protein
MLVQKFKSSSKEQALDLLEKSVAAIDEMQNTFPHLFPYSTLSDASAEFLASATASSNDKVAAAVTKTLDTLQAVSHTARTLEYFIQLHIPAIEDGGNFGVRVPVDVFFFTVPIWLPYLKL